MIKIRSEVQLVEVCGQEVAPANRGSYATTVEQQREPKVLLVESHGTRDDLVVLTLADRCCVTVRRRDLDAAVANATNTAKF